MTFKEKLQKERPERIVEDGWCIGCPDDYGYENKRDDDFCPIDEKGCFFMNCLECWNREIPEKEVMRLFKKGGVNECK